MNIEAIGQFKDSIISRIVQVLADVYNEDIGAVDQQNLSACMAFKGDPYLNELRLALERLERGDFGSCVLCKNEIEDDVLRNAPTSHFCSHCSQVVHQRISFHHSPLHQKL